MTILIADDDPLTLEALATCMEREGFKTLRAPDGREALGLWRAHKPELLCLDIMMPGVDGFEVCRRVRKSDRTIPILFLSAKNEERDVVAGLDLGADDFIRKPFTRGEVVARVRAALRRTGASVEDDHFSLEEFTVRPRALLGGRENEEVELTPREVSMLRLLHSRQGEVVSRDVFLDVCWGQDYFPDSRTLDQHVFLLRKKVEVDASNPQLIKTVRGVGYRFG